MKEEDLKEYFNIYTECWRMFRKYSDPVDDDEFWDSLVKEGNRIVDSSTAKEFAKKVVLSTIDEIERMHRKKGRQ